MNTFLTLNTFPACLYLCESNTELFQEDYQHLHIASIDHLRRGSEEAAFRAVERRLMLDEANLAPEGAIEWMRRLCQSKRRQKQLERDCRLVLDALKQAVGYVPQATLPDRSKGKEKMEGKSGGGAAKPMFGAGGMTEFLEALDALN